MLSQAWQSAPSLTLENGDYDAPAPSIASRYLYRHVARLLCFQATNSGELLVCLRILSAQAEVRLSTFTQSVVGLPDNANWTVPLVGKASGAQCRFSVTLARIDERPRLQCRGLTFDDVVMQVEEVPYWAATVLCRLRQELWQNLWIVQMVPIILFDNNEIWRPPAPLLAICPNKREKLDIDFQAPCRIVSGMPAKAPIEINRDLIQALCLEAGRIMENVSADMALVIPQQLDLLVAHVDELHRSAENISALANAAQALVQVAISATSTE